MFFFANYLLFFEFIVGLSSSFSIDLVTEFIHAAPPPFSPILQLFFFIFWINLFRLFSTVSTIFPHPCFFYCLPLCQLPSVMGFFWRGGCLNFDSIFFFPPGGVPILNIFMGQTGYLPHLALLWVGLVGASLSILPQLTFWLFAILILFWANV